MKKIIKTAISLILAVTFVLMSVCAFSSCTDESTDGENELILAEGGMSKYTVVYPAECAAVVKSAAEGIAEAINAETGASLQAVEDSAASTEYEIIIGDTNRSESAVAKDKMAESDYVVTVIGKKLCVFASKDSYYKTAASYIENVLVKGEKCAVASDHNYLGSKISAFTVDETVAESGITTIDITITPDSDLAQPGVFIGKEYDKGMFGYQGYCFVVTKNKMTLYKFNDEMEEMSSKSFYGIEKGEEIKLRLEIEKKACRAYVLDDPAGIEPWPEFAMEIKACKGYNIGYLELSGNGAAYKDLGVSYNESTATQTYTNAVYDGYADPDVLYYDGVYYMYATGGSGYLVHTSTDLVNWKKQANKAVEPNLWGITTNYWAPDVEYINGKFYMAVSCENHLGIAVSDSPLGPFLPTTDEVMFEKAIDGNFFVDDDGKVYLYYITWRQGKPYGIYGMQFDSNMNPLLGTETRLVHPTDQWELYEGKVTEGPYMIKHNGYYYLTYSGSHYKNDNYAVGYAVGKRPLGVFEKYADNPIMIGNTQINGVGHHCITYTPSGEMIIVYHCHNSTTQVQVRKMCIDRIRFVPVKGDVDKLEVYGPTTCAQPYPIP